MFLNVLFTKASFVLASFEISFDAISKAKTNLLLPKEYKHVIIPILNTWSFLSQGAISFFFFSLLINDYLITTLAYSWVVIFSKHVAYDQNYTFSCSIHKQWIPSIMDCGKTGWPDNVPLEVWKNLGDRDISWLTGFNEIMRSDKMSSE